MKKTNVKVLMSGGSFSGNKGAEAMYDSIIDELAGYYESIDVSILSKYPEDDKRGCDERGYRLVHFSTVEQLIYGGLFYIIGGALKKLHLPYEWMAGNRIKPFFENDVLIDASGIAFTDDRSFANVLINALWFLPALVTEIPIVKVSQTLGPYQKRYVRFFSELVLRRVKIIICRGQRSYDYTQLYLGTENIYNCPDTAFCLKTCDDTETAKLLNDYGLKANQYITVGPSFVMRDFLKPGEYAEIVSESINRLHVNTDNIFVFVPHSWRHSDKIGVDSINDDISVCREIIDKLNPDVKIVLIDREMSAREFKSIIGNSYMAIGSRYHFLIAALSSGVASLAMGWSHKYNELFREFDIEEYVMGYQDMNKQAVSDMVMKLFANCEEVADCIRNKLPHVIQRSRMNEKLIADYVNKNI